MDVSRLFVDFFPSIVHSFGDPVDSHSSFQIDTPQFFFPRWSGARFKADLRSVAEFERDPSNLSRRRIHRCKSNRLTVEPVDIGPVILDLPNRFPANGVKPRVFLSPGFACLKGR